MNIDDAKKEFKLNEDRNKELKKIINRGDIKSLMKRVKNYSDVCKELEEEELTEGDFDFLHKDQRKKQFLFHKLQTINRLFGFLPDWNNRNQYKWRPWFEKQASGWCFGDSDCFSYDSVAMVGFYPTEEISNYVGKTFLKEHTEFLELQ